MAENEVEGELSDNESDISFHGESEGEDSGVDDVLDRERVAERTSDDHTLGSKKVKPKKKKKK